MNAKQVVPALGLLVLFGVNAPSVESPRESKSELSTQIAEDVRAAVQRHRQSPTRKAWQETHFTPTEVFRNSRALRSSESAPALCEALSALPAAELNLFDNELASQESLPCAPALEKKLAEFQKESADELIRLRGSKAKASKAGTLIKRATEGQNLSERELSRGEIALVFDGGTRPERTRRISEILKAHSVRATFIPLGKIAQKDRKMNSTVLKQAVSAGHLVAATAWSGRDLNLMDLNRAKNEIQMGRQAILSATGKNPTLFHLPFDSSSAELEQLLSDQGLIALTPSLDSQDWKIQSASRLYESVLENVTREGKAILSFDDSLEQTSIVLPHLLEELKTRGFSFVLFNPA